MAKRRKARRKARPRRAAKAPTPRAVEAALAGIAHDIRTPLTGIVALAELLAASDLRPREREWANAVKSGAEHLAALSTLIVDAAKAEATGLTLRHEPFSPRALAQAVGQGLIARAGNKNVKAQFAIDDRLPPMVAGDALRLRAALENLCDNAVKFTSAGTVAFAASAALYTLVRTEAIAGGKQPQRVQKLACTNPERLLCNVAQHQSKRIVPDQPAHEQHPSVTTLRAKEAAVGRVRRLYRSCIFRGIAS